jgi:hypothetical protein
MEAPTPSSEDKQISETITIDQDNIRYILHLNSIGNTITFSLEYNSNNYSKKIPLKDIKDKESRAIFISYSPKDFFEYLKALSEMKKISVIRKDNSVIIKFEFEVMFKKHEIEIELRSKDNNLELLEKEVKELKENYNKIKEENILLKKEIEELKTEVKEIKKMLNPNFNINRIKIGNKSVIMKENEFDLIHLAIKSRLNKEVKELKKLYQATIDGDGGINFHSRCDNIPNTLVLIKSAGNRRFGGFTSVQWTSPTSGEHKDDPNAFLFSLDKQKIYSYKNDKKAIYCYKDYGPGFGGGRDIGIDQHGIQEKHLFTYESGSNCSYNFNGDNNALSEDGKGSYIYAAEYEVFQVIFS